MKNNSIVIRFMIAFSIMTIALLFVRCSGEKQLKKLEQKHPELFNTTKVHDTVLKPIITETKTIDTTWLPGATQTFTVQIPCPTATKTTYTHKFKGGYASLSIDSGIATIECPFDSLMEILTNVRDSVKILEIQTQTTMATTTVPAKLSDLDIFSIWLVRIVAIIAALYFGGKYLGPIIVGWFKPKI